MLSFVITAFSNNPTDQTVPKSSIYLHKPEMYPNLTENDFKWT